MHFTTYYTGWIVHKQTGAVRSGNKPVEGRHTILIFLVNLPMVNIYKLQQKN